jgi:hypothetical protein
MKVSYYSLKPASDGGKAYCLHKKNPVASILTGFNFKFVLYLVWLPLADELRNLTASEALYSVQRDLNSCQA